MMPLSLAQVGEENIIKRIGGSPEVKRHLENLGFVVGGEVTVVNTLGGNVIVNVKEARVAISKYLSGSENLGVVCQLIDIRHKPMDSDMECFNWLRSCGLKVQVVLTKSDKLSKNAAMSQKALFKREMGLKEHEIITYSSSQHTMRGELIERIMNALSANGVEQE